MDSFEKISIFSCAVVAAASAYSYLGDALYAPSFGLAKTGYMIGFLVPLLSAYIIYKNEKTKSRQMAQAVAALNIALFFFLVSPSSYSVVSIAVMLLIFLSLVSSLKLMEFSLKKITAIFFVGAAMMLFVQILYLEPSTQIARGSGTVLTDNWFAGLNWIKSNTQNCSVVATYWDPGHFIRGIANRAVVFDGATQGSTRTIPAPGHEDGLVVEQYESGIKHIIDYKNGTAKTSRINDIAITLMTSNESFAVELLEKYRIPDCDMYYLATSDLIGKSVWWTYFSTWDPTVSKGTAYSYQVIGISSARPLINQNAIAYTYPLSQDQAFLIIGVNNTFRAYLQQGNSQLVPIETLLYYSDAGNLLVSQDPSAPVKGAILAQPDKQLIIYMPPEIQNSMFTRMFLFNGAGLNNFEFINQWGGEVKLFKVKFDN